MNQQKITIMGAGFAGLAASCYLAKMGYQVTILEKNSTVGGRARQLKKNGFIFDIGPSFYWMPDVFDQFFGDFGKKTSDYYQLDKLNPGYQAYFGVNDSISIADNFEEVKQTFEKIEKGSGDQLQKFIDQAETNYRIAIKDLVYKPGENIFEIITKDSAKQLWQFFSTIKKEVAKRVKHPSLKKILEFPVLFLGAKPSNTPAFYSFMNYADLKLGTWHPQGGMYKVIEGMESLAKELGVAIHANQEVMEILTESNTVKSVKCNDKTYECDVLLSGADYAHTESLLPKNLRQYSDDYWDKKTFAPSSLLFYVGFDKKIDNVSHHTLFFDASFDDHAKTIYDTKEWPEDPLFYCSFPSKTDDSCAPEGKEAAVFLIPLAPDLEDNEEIRDQYFNILLDRLELNTQQSIREYILFKESYCINEFKEDYHAYKGNAYGLANTLLQTHILRPKLKSKKVKNLYFTGQLTVPGPGVPPSLISGKIVSELIYERARK